MSQQHMPPATRRLMTFFIMSAAVMNQLDTTIANVALPQATMISYIEAFQILFVIAMLATSIVFLLRPTKRQ